MFGSLSDRELIEFLCSSGADEHGPKANHPGKPEVGDPLHSPRSQREGRIRGSDASQARERRQMTGQRFRSTMVNHLSNLSSRFLDKLTAERPHDVFL